MNEVKNLMHKNPKTTTNVGLVLAGLLVSGILPSWLFWGGMAAGGVGYIASGNFRGKVKNAHASLVNKVQQWTR